MVFIFVASLLACRHSTHRIVHGADALVRLVQEMGSIAQSIRRCVELTTRIEMCLVDDMDSTSESSTLC